MFWDFPPSLRSSSSKLAQLTLEQILEHLDNLRLNLTNTKQNCGCLPGMWDLGSGLLSLTPFPPNPLLSPSFQPDPDPAGAAARPGQLR